MERELWPLLYQELRAAARDFRQKYVRHQPWAVAAVLLWAALHDRPLSWACQPRHWSTTRLRPASVPSQPTVSRRVRRTAFGCFLNRLTERLFGQLSGGGYALADGNYDASRLFDRAGARGYQLVAAQRDQNPGKGHRYQSPHRLRCIALLATPFGRDLYARRVAAETAFGNATAFAGGLGPLPAWVRRRHRVELWAWAKLAINAARIIRRQRLAA